MPPAVSTGPVMTVGDLRVRDRRIWRLRFVANLLDPANRALLDHLPGVRRLLVVAPAAEQRRRLERYLDAQCRRRLLDGYQVAPVDTGSAGPPLSTIGRLGEAAAAAGLARRDAFLICGHGAGVDEALVAAAMYRRHTPAVAIVTDPYALAAVARGAGRTSVAGGIRLQHRQLTVLVDEAVLRRPTTEPPAPVARVTHRTVSCRVQLVSGIFNHPAPARPEPARAGPAPPRGDQLAGWLPPRGRVLAVVDAYSPEVVAATRRYLRHRVRDGSLAGFALRRVASTPAAKSLPGVQELVQAATAAGLGPGDRILAVGGGTVLDLVGTAALLYAGATPYLRIPTTLVGMIDAGIGLKVGVDLNHRKNLLGGYHPPLACLCDEDFLATLPEAEIRCGLAEAVKIAAVTDGDLFALIERHWPDLVRRARTAPVRRIISRSIRTMLGQLSANPFEQDLLRLPDFGHEFGHLLEAASGYRLRHGEAVSVGMALSGELAVLTGRLAEPAQARLVGLLRRIGLPTFDPLCEPGRLWDWLRRDICAHKGGAPHLVVPTVIGAGTFIHSLSELGPDLLRRACATLAGRS